MKLFQIDSHPDFLSCGGIASGRAGRIQKAALTPLRNVLTVLLLVAAPACWAIPCPANMKDFDHDPPVIVGDPGDIDIDVDACVFLGQFKVPAVPASELKDNFSGNGGWGSLVLTFDRPIDGGSFVFGPDCPDPLNGKLSDDGKSILLSPLLSKPAQIYSLGATGTQSPSGKGEFKTFDVTILYDVDLTAADGGVPNLVFGYWKAKRTDFVYRPNPGDYAATGNQAVIFDVPLPVPSTLYLLCAGVALVLAFSWKAKGRRPFTGSLQ